ncbi:MAG: hypothetical protein AAF560_19755 [Acidobacteriota bacterium]
MKAIQAVLAIIVASLFIVSFGFAADGSHVERQVKIKVDDGAEMISLDASDLEVGETYESYTDSGKRVLLTRTEEGFDLEVDGKQIDLGFMGGQSDHSSFTFHSDEASKVIIKHLDGDADSESFAFLHGDCEGDDCAQGLRHWVHKLGDEDVDVIIQRTSAAEHLEASGVLDELDEETRQRILDTLNERSPRVQKKVFIDVREEVHEEIED